jgi:hypothetical protein
MSITFRGFVLINRNTRAIFKTHAIHVQGFDMILVHCKFIIVRGFIWTFCQSLSSAFNQICDSDLQVPFDFKINGRFLHQAFSATLQSGILSVVRKMDQQTANAWISSVHFFTEGLPSSLSDGTVHIYDNGGDRAYRHADQMPCPIGHSQLIAGDLDGIVRARASLHYRQYGCFDATLVDCERRDSLSGFYGHPDSVQCLEWTRRYGYVM